MRLLYNVFVSFVKINLHYNITIFSNSLHSCLLTNRCDISTTNIIRSSYVYIIVNLHCYKSTSYDKFIFDVTVWKIKRFCFLSGSGNSIFLSNRPGLKRAGSKVSALFVDIITFTFVLCSKPSIWFKSSIKTLWTSLSAPVCASKRLF